MKKEKNDPKNAPPLPFAEKKTRGKFTGKSCVAYALSLPLLSLKGFAETEAFLEEIQNAYLAFLEKKSGEEWEGVRFGGLSFRTEGRSVLLLACLSPFAQREFFPVARLCFSEDGALTRVHQIKGKKRESA